MVGAQPLATMESRLSTRVLGERIGGGKRLQALLVNCPSACIDMDVDMLELDCLLVLPRLVRRARGWARPGEGQGEDRARIGQGLGEGGRVKGVSRRGQPLVFGGSAKCEPGEVKNALSDAMSRDGPWLSHTCARCLDILRNHAAPPTPDLHLPPPQLPNLDPLL